MLNEKIVALGLVAAGLAVSCSSQESEPASDGDLAPLSSSPPAPPAGAPPPAAPLAPPPGPCRTGLPGMTSTFWGPYLNWSAQRLDWNAYARSLVGNNTVIVQWTVDTLASGGRGAAWYPSKYYPYFETTLPDILAMAARWKNTVWVGLSIAPGEWEKFGNNPQWLSNQIIIAKKVADELAEKYGSAIAGWYVPYEPGEFDLATYNLAYQTGWFFGQIADYLHTHDGNKPVMISPAWAGAANSGISPVTFARQMQPMLEVAHVDVINVQDGAGTSGLSASAMAAGFAELQKITKGTRTQVWDDAEMFTATGPLPAARLRENINAVAPYVQQISGFTFPENLDPWVSAPNKEAWLAYYNACHGP